jgi:nitronate monooxygenase
MVSTGAMSTEATRRLGVTHPIVQGPFGGGLSTTRLAATVSELGGLGSFGAVNLAPADDARVGGRIAPDLRHHTAPALMAALLETLRNQE